MEISGPSETDTALALGALGARAVARNRPGGRPPLPEPSGPDAPPPGEFDGTQVASVGADRFGGVEGRSTGRGPAPRRSPIHTCESGSPIPRRPNPPKNRRY